MRRNIFKRGVSCLASAAMVAMMVPAVGAGTAAADTAQASGDVWWSSFEPTAAVAPDTNLVTTYGVRAGSAGGDYVGVTNTNFDFTAAGSKATSQYTGYQGASATDKSMAGLAIWGSSANVNANPYYANLFYSVCNPSTSVEKKATTWSNNPESSSWGDTLDTTSKAGMEFDGPSIVFGANKTAGWNSTQKTGTNFGTYDDESTAFNPVYVNNDATNIWTQVYTMGQLASAADGISGKTTRYGSAATSALNYEKAIRGNMLYIASQIDAKKASKKTVAYLYAIDGDYAYFFTPQASDMTSGDDTGKEPAEGMSEEQKKDAADDNYAANNGTIDLGYMATLPYITNTFSAGTSTSITMKVEDIYKKNPACKVALTKLKSALSAAKVDVIIYNTNTSLTEAGTSAGKNSNGIVNSVPLTEQVVDNYLPTDRTCNVLAGDDYGTSTKQNAEIVDQAPLLYCQRNYTADKNTRAAWAFSKVYPELYENQSDSTYANWVRNIYHIKDANVNSVVAYMTNQKSADEVQAVSEAKIQSYFETGYKWWTEQADDSVWKTSLAKYTGSTRASYYGDSSAELAGTTKIGIFEPSAAWKNATHGTAGDGVVNAVSTQSVSVLDVPDSEENAQTVEGIKWWTTGTDSDITLHIARSASTTTIDNVDYIPGEFTGESIKRVPWLSVQYTSIVVHEGVTKLARSVMFNLDGTGFKSMKSISLPASLVQIGGKNSSGDYGIFAGSNGVSDDFELTIAGLDKESYWSSQLKRIYGPFGANNYTFSTEWDGDEDFPGVNPKTSKLEFFYPEDCVITNSDPWSSIKEATGVSFAKKTLAVPTLDATSFEFDNTEKSVTVSADADCVVSGKTSATEAGSYAISVALPSTAYYQWADESTEAAKTLVWSIVDNSKQEAAEKAAADAEAKAKAAEKAAADAEANAAAQMAQDLDINTANKVVKCKKGKKKLAKAAKTSKVKVSGAQGAVTFAKVVKGSSKKLTVSNDGKITVKKGTKKGSYKIKVKATAAASGSYKATSSTVVITVVVK